MQKIVLPNGLTVIYEKRKTLSVVIEIMVKTGSNHESEKERGISHFLEHLLFEGTIKRPSNWAISREIEKVGGEFNAYTTNERTCFYVQVLKKHFPIALEVLADIIQNSLLRTEDIEREKNVVLKEIDLVLDEPRFYQWILLQKSLFKTHPCKYPTYGDKKHIINLNKEKIKNFMDKYYYPGNMVISMVGTV
ncbi:insulinase family protein, partial [Candidatus Woesearchaeota archaeon]|nr:insulinase family protein [Candidatus Woesearchaeota archaeon]